MNVRAVSLGLAALGLVLGASAPCLSQADDVAHASPPPIMIGQYLSAITWIYWKNSDRYDSLAYNDHDEIYNRFTALSFTNTSSQALTEVQFDLTAYDNNRPILGKDGNPVVKHMKVTGTLAPGESRTVKNDNTVWAMPVDNQFTCARVTAIQLSFADGSGQTLSTPQDVRRAMAPQINVDCGGVYQPTMAGVYPPRDVILGIEERALWRQPFVPPTDTQELN